MAIATRTAAVLGLVPFLIGMGAAPALADDTQSARGSFSIENEELTDAETSNEVKVGCDFRIDFFGFTLQTVPVTFTVMAPSGNGETLEPLVANLVDSDPDTGNDLSGSLDVSLLDDLQGIEPAQAQDFDYKVRVEAVVKVTPGTEVTKSKILFIVCDTGADEVTPAPVTPTPVTPTPDTSIPVTPTPVTPTPVTPSPVVPAPVEDSGTLSGSAQADSPESEDSNAGPQQRTALAETGASPLPMIFAAVLIAGGWALRRFSMRTSA